MMAYVAVNGIGEIDDGGAARHRHDLPLRREHIDSLGKQIDLDVVPEFSRIVRLLLNIEQ